MDNWYGLYKIGSELADDRLRIANEERLSHAMRKDRNVGGRPAITRAAIVLIAFARVFIHGARPH